VYKAVKGSRSGLFIPESESAGEGLYVVEGPTDTAAALTPGLSVVGRPRARAGKRCWRRTCGASARGGPSSSPTRTRQGCAGVNRGGYSVGGERHHVGSK